MYFKKFYFQWRHLAKKDQWYKVYIIIIITIIIIVIIIISSSMP
jgi:hypothetical protein